MRRGAGIVALVITFLVVACTQTNSSAPTARVAPTPMPSGVPMICTDNYQSSHSMGPLQDGLYAHYLCQDGKVTNWWFDGNGGIEDSPPH